MFVVLTQCGPGGLKGRGPVALSEAKAVAEGPLSDRSEDMSLGVRQRAEGFRGSEVAAATVHDERAEALPTFTPENDT